MRVPECQDSDQTGDENQANAVLIAALAPLATQLSLSKGEVLCNEGDDADCLYWVTAGMLEISVLSEEGRRLTLDIARRGAILGEIAMFDPGPRTATITALDPSDLCRVRHGDVRAALSKDPTLASDLFRIAGQRMRWMNTQMMEQATLIAPVRIARRLLYLTKGSPEALHLSQEELADFSGTTREAVSRAFKVWKAANLIEVNRRGIRVLNRDTLAVLADLPGD